MPRANRDLTTIADTIEPTDHIVPPALRAKVHEVVAAHARDGEDRRLLLEALGLSAGEDRTPSHP
ncbi:hypothetical protein ACIRBX_01640 [Kitasatospora sp. NPDC096147]|uniref:hypothetical protein n=1 Tax=Kitasatospora sp. NPDC096147 TaxID=3364093 RepID=UPI00380A99CC